MDSPNTGKYALDEGQVRFLNRREVQQHSTVMILRC